MFHIWLDETLQKTLYLYLWSSRNKKKNINIARDGCPNNNSKSSSNKLIVQVDNPVHSCSNDKGRTERTIVIIISSHWMRLSML